ncbi:unnamed protein product [Candidula unifasciata]|uniref:Transmembrane protein n=1 Tax=Candidula unifasciata TaxID=100452 RepID=A0A8S4A549_9EUPU|nr:unnamed protein product [Candidula unifasciata]
MESPVDEELIHLREAEDEDNIKLKHADSDSVNSIPPPPLVTGMVVPVASQESCDISETEKMKLTQEVQDGQEQNWQQEKTEHAVGQHANCCDKLLKCLGSIPCPSLLSWIMLLLGISTLTGSLLVGVWRTRALLKDDSLLWFMEYTIIGVVVSMFVIGTLLLTAGHLSSEPTSRRVFSSLTKNRCAQGLNIFALVITYFLAVCWVLIIAILTTPLVLIVNIIIVNPDTLDLKNYAKITIFNGDGAWSKIILNMIVIILPLPWMWLTVFVSPQQICFIVCISANITHLKDNRFSTLNAYEEEEVRNSKHSMLDTDM